MKKLFYLLVVTFLLGVVFTSCSQKKSVCPVYNTYKLHQIEKPF